MLAEEKLSSELIERAEIVVSDYDNVIQWIDLPWIMNIDLKNKWDIFRSVFDTDKIRDILNNPSTLIERLSGRDEYYLDRYFLKDKKYYPNKFRKEWMDLYEKDGIFYDKSPITSLGRSLVGCCQQKFVKKIIFLTHDTDLNKPDTRKDRRIKDLFKNSLDKIEIAHLPMNCSKGEWLVENNIKFTLYIEDRFDIIKDVIDKTNCKNNAIFMPLFGYNKHYSEDEKFRDTLLNNRIEFATYNNACL